MMDNVHQCKSCPWRVGVVPETDIPNYSRELHQRLKTTIVSGLSSLSETRHVMACHCSTAGNEFPCAGWLHNQITNNNLSVRLSIASKMLPVPIIDGPQHPTFEDTLTKES